MMISIADLSCSGSAATFYSCTVSFARFQQPQRCIVSDTLLANERGGTGFGTLIRVSAAKSNTDDPSSHRSRDGGWSMFLAGDFPLPSPVRTTVGAEKIKECVATTYRAIAQFQDGITAALDPI